MKGKHRVRVVKLGTPIARPASRARSRVARFHLSKWELLIVAIVAGLWLIPTFFPSVVPPVPPPHPINISTEQYDSALAKWKSYNIEEYEISEEYKFTSYGLDSLAGMYTLRVSDNGKKREEIGSKPHSTNPSNQAWTVEEMFETVETLVKEDKARVGPHGDYVSGIVELHPEFGYPTYLELRATSKRGEVVGSWENTVTSFKILRQGTPTPGNR